MKTAAILLGLFSAAFFMPALREEPKTLIVGDFDECVVDQCPDEFAICSDEDGCVRDFLTCQGQCKDKISCFQLCLAKKGNTKASALLKCVIDKGCFDQSKEMMSSAVAVRDDPIIECVKEKCPHEYEKCANDSKCIPVITDCQKKCGTKQTCWEFCLAGKGNSNATNVAKCAASQHCI